MFANMSPSAWAELVGGVFIFIYFMIQVVQKIVNSTKWGKERKEERDKEKLERAHEQYQRFTDDFVKSFVPPLMKQLTDQDERLLENINLLKSSSNDLLRKDMTDIYYKYLPYKRILQFEKECFIKLYDDYVKQGGNSYIQHIYAEMMSWEVVLKKEELTK